MHYVACTCSDQSAGLAWTLATPDTSNSRTAGMHNLRVQANQQWHSFNFKMTVPLENRACSMLTQAGKKQYNFDCKRKQYL
ncbi:hypothetical protein DUNSADRAFT_3277 [Dunaliella salina]|uniref:Encoded protein n=1 Tax=Dunaliella salina TaxID=3046 RepID=A0ABQ7FVN0_DUNSA|nr:hypothetical protein DUNSADRAFT_3277 [Dunaliella salina]|eukprot:KAF5826403.1 hypothetical protein DUNSADRAFT_3277 [Dunaliella salina]